MVKFKIGDKVVYNYAFKPQREIIGIIYKECKNGYYNVKWPNGWGYYRTSQLVLKYNHNHPNTTIFKCI